ncbi:MAG TPA: amidohydrolase/deacetylase family metallohydrolase [Bryobacteraceae bacterium]|nr:amidohydrolase/deacetylase family metallohydrolase [Bryobacteraceae bacterium]
MRLGILALALSACLYGQSRYDLLLKGGHVIDPANQRDGVMDVAVKGNTIARVASAIPAGEAVKVLDVSGLYVTPGLIDLHAHVYGYSGSIFPDDTALIAGTTTVVDAGGAGWRTFDDFYEKIIRPSRTRVLAFLNIVGRGMLGGDVESNVDDMDPERTAAKIRERRDYIVGIKTAHFALPGWVAIDRAVKAGELSGTPVMVDDKILTGAERDTRTKLLEKLRPGDMHTHMYNDRQLELVDRFTGRVQPYVLEARKKGVLFDLGHGAGSFLWPVAVKAMRQGFAPDTISTDLHSSSIMIAESDMPNCISKLMNLGMTLQEGIAKSTVRPAEVIRRYPELGTLGEGRVADISVFELRTGVFAFKDAWHKKMLGNKKLEAVATIRDGKLVYDRKGLGFPEWTKAGDYGVIP